MKYHIAIVIFGIAYVIASPIATVEEGIWRDLEKSDLINIKVTFKKADTAAAYERFHSLKLKSRNARLTAQHAILKNHADAVQFDVVVMLNKADGKRHHLDQLWISNELIVRNVDRETVEKLRNHPDVKSLIAEEFIPLEKTIVGESFDIRDNNTIMNNQWGIEFVGAPDVWARVGGTTGDGIVIGNTDTGARYTHNLLASSYRGYVGGAFQHDFNWFDPSTRTSAPFDLNGHGSHTIGTHSGTQGIGVAPGSKWASCRGCATEECSHLDLQSCGNFWACPVNVAGEVADCSQAPHIVNNSWGGEGDNLYYNDILTAWEIGGICGIFSIGNSGNFCGNAGYPGDQMLAVGVGSINSNSALSTFSSFGEASASYYKPDVVGPGEEVVSASNVSNTGLRTLSGTSMAAPHVSGIIALFLSKTLGTREDAITAITKNALPHQPQGLGLRNCVVSLLPPVLSFERVRPNFFVGYGIASASASVPL